MLYAENSKKFMGIILKIISTVYNYTRYVVKIEKSTIVYSKNKK